MMSLRVVNRMQVPAYLSIVLAKNPVIPNDERKGSFPGSHVTENFNEGAIRQVDPQTEDVEVHKTYAVGSYDGRLSTDINNAAEDRLGS